MTKLPLHDYNPGLLISSCLTCGMPLAEILDSFLSPKASHSKYYLSLRDKEETITTTPKNIPTMKLPENWALAYPAEIVANINLAVSKGELCLELITLVPGASPDS